MLTILYIISVPQPIFDIDAVLEGRNLANQMRLDYPDPDEYPLTEIRAQHWLQDLIDSEVLKIPAESNLSAEVAKVYAAARAFWPELRHLPDNEGAA